MNLLRSSFKQWVSECDPLLGANPLWYWVIAILSPILYCKYWTNTHTHTHTHTHTPFTHAVLRVAAQPRHNLHHSSCAVRVPTANKHHTKHTYLRAHAAHTAHIAHAAHAACTAQRTRTHAHTHTRKHARTRHTCFSNTLLMALILPVPFYLVCIYAFVFGKGLRSFCLFFSHSLTHSLTHSLAHSLNSHS